MEIDIIKPKPKSKSKKVDFDKIAKYMPPRPDDPNIVYDPSMKKMMIEAALNEMENEKRRKEEAKRWAEEQRRMKEYEEKQREYRKLQLERIANLPNQQFEIFASGQRFQCSCCHIGLNFEAFCPNTRCPNETAISTEPLMMRISEELSESIRLDEPTRARLDEIRRPDEKTYQDIVNRLLDNSEAKPVIPLLLEPTDYIFKPLISCWGLFMSLSEYPCHFAIRPELNSTDLHFLQYHPIAWNLRFLYSAERFSRSLSDMNLPSR
jgi:hypothetical protein